MSVSSINTDTISSTQDWRSVRRTAADDFQSLVQSLQQNNLASAQQAYSSIQQLFSNGSSSAQDATTSSSSATNGIIGDWQALGQALQSGSVSGAQSALSTLQQDAFTAVQSRSQAVQDASAVYAAMQTPGSTSSTSGTPSLQNDLNSLGQALQSGDTASAQKLLSQLENDLQQTGQAQGHHHHHHHGGSGQSQQTSATTNNSYASSTIAATTSAVATQV